MQHWKELYGQWTLEGGRPVFEDSWKHLPLLPSRGPPGHKIYWASNRLNKCPAKVLVLLANKTHWLCFSMYLYFVFCIHPPKTNTLINNSNTHWLLCCRNIWIK